MQELTSFLFILLIGSASGFIGSMVGSGGLISIPLLIIFGLPAPVAIATDRMGTIGLSLGAVPKYWKAKKNRMESDSTLLRNCADRRSSWSEHYVIFRSKDTIKACGNNHDISSTFHSSEKRYRYTQTQ